MGIPWQGIKTVSSGLPDIQKTRFNHLQKNPSLKITNHHQTILCFQKYLVQGKSNMSEEASRAETVQAR